MGQLREGQTVLVDDGSCPPGQIKEVIGGNHVSVGGTKHILRHASAFRNRDSRAYAVMEGGEAAGERRDQAAYAASNQPSQSR